MSYRFCSLSQSFETRLLKFLKSHRAWNYRQNIRLMSSINLHTPIFYDQAPKGFEKYFPDGKKSKSDTQRKEASSEKKNDEIQEKPSQTSQKSQPDWAFKLSFGSGGSKKGGKNPFSPDDDNRYVALALFGTLGVLAVIAYNEFKYKEITWKEFVNSYLARNIVEKLEVVNKKWVRVRFIPGNQMDGNKYWFNIGSVDTFERNLENVQLEMNVEPANFVPVVYKSEMDGSGLLSYLPGAIVIGLILWNMRRTAGMMGGGGGRRVGGLFGMGETTAKLINPSEIGVKFKDVAGCEEAKVEIMEFVNFLKNPQLLP